MEKIKYTMIDVKTMQTLNEVETIHVRSFFAEIRETSQFANVRNFAVSKGKTRRSFVDPPALFEGGQASHAGRERSAADRLRIPDSRPRRIRLYPTSGWSFLRYRFRRPRFACARPRCRMRSQADCSDSTPPRKARLRTS